MCGSLCLVIKTVNDRGGTDKKAWGGVRGLVVRVGVCWRFEPSQSCRPQ